MNPGVIIEYLFDKSSKKNDQIQVKVARKTTDFKTFIYGRTCTAWVQEHVQRCSSRFTSTKFNSCTEIITVRHVSQIWFLARYTVIIVTLTTTKVRGLSSAEVGEVGLPAAHLTAHVGQEDVIIPFGHL